MKPVGRQAPIKLSFLCKIPWMQKFQLDTGHFLWTWQCIFICNSAVTPSSGAWLCLVPGCAPCRPVAVKSSRWRRPVMRSGARVTLNIGHAHFTQAPDPSPTLIFSRSLAKRSFFIDFYWCPYFRRILCQLSMFQFRIQRNVFNKLETDFCQQVINILKLTLMMMLVPEYFFISFAYLLFVVSKKLSCRP